jgi:hypothetical protein
MSPPSVKGRAKRIPEMSVYGQTVQPRTNPPEEFAKPIFNDLQLFKGTDYAA